MLHLKTHQDMSVDLMEVSDTWVNLSRSGDSVT